ncbi:hypothetical protein ACFQVC_17685 [Streptomyces monticola]|uniref:Type II toxin-antitoxin system RelE/ParE family toxin n=1 Tax=Streptomyces monticola TaxID=2666263 RepID=A0ABW2JK91_9ACTN
MPKHGPRRAQITFHEVAERQLAALSDEDLARLDPVLVDISINPKLGDPVPSSPMLRDYRRGSVRVMYYATALGMVIVVAYAEA